MPVRLPFETIEHTDRIWRKAVVDTSGLKKRGRLWTGERGE